MNTDDRPASLWLVPQLNVPICAAVSSRGGTSSPQSGRRTGSACPDDRQTRARTGNPIANRIAAQPSGGRSGTAYFTATAFPPQRDATDHRRGDARRVEPVSGSSGRA